MITIVNYGVGNLASIQNILKKIGVPSRISSSREEVAEAERLILPGVGAFDSCAQKLAESGLSDVLNTRVLEDKIPVLGICVGMQLMLSQSEEGNRKGLNWIPGNVVKFQAEKLSGLKVPHMSWTDVKLSMKSNLLDNMHESPRFYFVHSYHARVEDSSHELMSAEYGYEFTAAIQRDNIVGVQFHPEKSHKFGMKLFQNFAT